MQQHVEDEVRDYGFLPLEEETMPESMVHAELIEYLVAVLKWLFWGQTCTVCRNLAFLAPRERGGLVIAPDIALVRSIPRQPVSSWRIGRTGPAPVLVFEILSEETWKKDVEEKPLVYAQLGVHEYFAYDPNLTPLAGPTAPRLSGWRLDPDSQSLVALTLLPDRSLWSQELESFLVPDEQVLRLVDEYGRTRLTRAEAEAAARRAEAQRADAEARRAAAMAEMLRSMGIDPDQLP
jgi:Uma2 family endonuclease